MAQRVCMTGSVRGANGAYMVFEDVDALSQAFDDLQSALTLLDTVYKQVDTEGWLVCPAPFHRGIDDLWGNVRQYVETLGFYLQKLDKPMGRIIEQDEGRPDGQEDVTD